MGENRTTTWPRAVLRWLRQPLGQPPPEGDALAWAAVWLTAGVFLWFALPQPPAPWFGAVAGTALLALRLWRWRTDTQLASPPLAALLPPVVWLLPMALVLLGLALAGWRIHVQQTPLLPANIGGTVLAGVVEQVRPHRPDQARMVLRVRHVGRLQRAFWPRRVRITITGLKAGQGENGGDRSFAALPLPGDVVRLRARLLRLPQPVEPGAYDPARELYMAGIGAVGFASVRGIEVLGEGCGKDAQGRGEEGCSAWLWLERGLEHMRRVISRAFDSYMDDPIAAALAKALTIGARGALPPRLHEQLRAAGLAHILAISGLHLALLAGAVFWLARAGLALSARLAVHWPLKKVAAFIAWLVALAYLLLSGNSVATQRAFIMLSVALLAVMVDRPAISMRNLAIAALCILLIWPHKALSAGFQMSFLAVMGLVAGYEAFNWWRHQRRRLHLVRAQEAEHRSAGPWREAGRWLLAAVGGLAFTTIIASVYTALPAAWHFNRLPVHGLWGNMAALPLLSFVVMPAGLLTLALLPVVALLRLLGLEAMADALPGWPLALMQWGLTHMAAAAGEIASLPGGWWHVPALTASATLLLSAGLLWLALRNDRLRLLGLLPMALVLGGMWPAFAPRPDVLVEERARLVAVRMADGRLAATPGRAGSFALRIWLRRDGDAAPPGQARRRGGWQCDELMCRARLRSGARILYLRDVFRRSRGKQGTEGADREQALEAMQAACMQADVVIAAFPLRGLCRATGGGGRQPKVVIGRFDVWRHGAHALYLQPDGRWQVRTVSGEGRALPWRRAPLPRHEVMLRTKAEAGAETGARAGKSTGRHEQ